MAKFKILRGKHVEFGVIYSQGQIVDSKKDLCTLNSPGFTDKFERVSTKEAVGGTPLPNQPRPVASPLADRPVTMAPGGQVASGFQGEESGGIKPANLKRSEDLPPGTPGAQPPGPSSTTPATTFKSQKDYHDFLDKCSDVELKKFAEEEEIDLKGASTRGSILKVLKAVK